MSRTVISVMPVSAGLAVLYGAVFLPVFTELSLSLAGLTAAFAAILIWASIVDFQSFRIPDLASFSVAALGLIAIWLVDTGLLAAHVLTAVMGFALLWGIGEVIFRYRGIEALGIGDAKLFSAGLLWVGPLGGPTVLLLASMTGIAYAVLTFILKKSALTHKIPFGPFLAFAIFAVWLHGPIVF